MRVLRLGQIMNPEIAVICQYCDSLIKLSLTDKHIKENNGFSFTCCVCGNGVWVKEKLLKRESSVIAEADTEATNYIETNNRSPEAYNAFLAGFTKATDDNPILRQVIETMRVTKSQARCYTPGPAYEAALAVGWVKLWDIISPIASNNDKESSDG